MDRQPLLTSQEMIPREPTVPSKPTKKEWRSKIREMLMRKNRVVVYHELMCTNDKGLRLVQQGALNQGMIDYANFIAEFRELKVKATKN